MIVGHILYGFLKDLLFYMNTWIVCKTTPPKGLCVSDSDHLYNQHISCLGLE